MLLLLQLLLLPPPPLAPAEGVDDDRLSGGPAAYAVRVGDVQVHGQAELVLRVVVRGLLLVPVVVAVVEVVQLVLPPAAAGLVVQGE